MAQKKSGSKMSAGQSRSAALDEPIFKIPTQKRFRFEGDASSPSGIKRSLDSAAHVTNSDSKVDSLKSLEISPRVKKGSEVEFPTTRLLVEQESTRDLKNVLAENIISTNFQGEEIKGNKQKSMHQNPIHSNLEKEASNSTSFADDGSSMSATRVRKLVARLARCHSENQKLRIKYPDDPEKFMASEVALDDATMAICEIATAPKYYPLATQAGLPNLLASLLAHENPDVALAAVQVLVEMTDEDVVYPSDLNETLSSISLQPSPKAVFEKTGLSVSSQVSNAEGVSTKSSYSSLVFERARKTEKGSRIENDVVKYIDSSSDDEKDTLDSDEDSEDEDENQKRTTEKELDRQQARLLHGIRDFVQVMVEKHGALELIDAAFENDKNAEARYKFFGLFENLATLGFDKLLCERTKIVSYVLGYLREKNSPPPLLLYAAELASVLMQASFEARIKFVEADAVDAALVCLSEYRSEDPKGADWIEFMNTIFVVLCQCLSIELGIKKFREAEGLELMLILIQSRLLARVRAVEVLSYATLVVSAEGRINAIRLIENGGATAIFNLFMQSDRKILKAKYKKAEYSDQKDDENIVSLVLHMLRACAGVSISKVAEPALLEKIIDVFTSCKHEKLVRVVELVTLYMQRVKPFLDLTTESLPEVRDTVPDITEEQHLLRMERGLFTLTELALIVGILCKHSQECKEYLATLLSAVGITQDAMRAVLLEHIKFSTDQVYVATILHAIEF